MRMHSIAFGCGFLLDLLLGDPKWMPHPVRGIGTLISWFEKKTYGKNENRNEKRELWQGGGLVFFVLGVTFIVAFGLLHIANWIHPAVGFVVEAWMTYQLLATRCLKVESMAVYEALTTKTLEEARKAVSMIVGRDTKYLDEEQIAKAAIETVAENTSDGVLAPMLYTALGGPVLGWLYKAINTMDSMVGYKNDRYLSFGRWAAKLDDVVNYVPARISAWLMIGVAFLGGKQFSGINAYRIYRRDCRKHASPNSAQTEAVCAGALQVQLAGDAQYFGKVVKKPYIGDPLRPVECEDIKRANGLMCGTAWLGAFLCIVVLLLF